MFKLFQKDGEVRNGFKTYSAGLFFCIVLFVSFYRLGSVSLFDVDEAVFAEATKEMVQSGDWITPTYNGVNRYDKPILFYWMMAVSYKIFGINEFGARFPSAFSGVLLSIAVFLFVGRSIGEKSALYAAAALVLSPYYFLYSHAAVTDMALTLFITLSLFSFYLSETEERGFIKADWYRLGFYFFSALAFLTKGLIGIVFPFGIAVAYLVLAKGFRAAPRLFSLKGMALFLLISGPWYAAEFSVNGREFFQQFFIKHHFQRYTEVISGHRGPIYYYVPALIAGLFPWVAFLPMGMGKKTTGEPKIERSVRLLSLVWFGAIIVFFSLSTTKLPNYALPAIPAASILIAIGMARHRPAVHRYPYWMISGMAALAGTGFIVGRHYLLKAGINDTAWVLAAGGIMFFIAAVAVYALFSGKKPFVFMSAAMICFLLLVSLKALPVVNRQLQGPLYDYSLLAKKKLDGNGKLVAFGVNNPSIVFYSGHNINNADCPEIIRKLMGDGKKIIVIARTEDLPALGSLGLNLLGKSEKFACLENQ